MSVWEGVQFPRLTSPRSGSLVWHSQGRNRELDCCTSMSKTIQAGAAPTVRITGLGVSTVLSDLAGTTASKGGER